MIRIKQNKIQDVSIDNDHDRGKKVIDLVKSASFVSSELTGTCLDMKDVIHDMLYRSYPESFASVLFHRISKQEEDDDYWSNSIVTSSLQHQSWVVVYASIPDISRHHLVISSFHEAVMLGNCIAKPVVAVALLMTPAEGPILDSGENFSTLLASLFTANHQWLYRSLCHSRSGSVISALDHTTNMSEKATHSEKERFLNIITGMTENMKRRMLKYYLSDITDGLQDLQTVSKVISSSFFLFFLCILPCVAFGVLNSKNTNDKLNADRALIGQAVGGLLYAFVAGQPFVIIATTAPMSLCTRIIFVLSQSFEIEFYSLYATVGLFNCFFLIMYGLLGMSSIIRFSRRCVEEIFLMFSFVCFMNDAFADIYDLFFKDQVDNQENDVCGMNCKLLFLLLLLGTSFLSQVLFAFKFSRFCNPFARETISDYAVPLSVVVFSVIGFLLKSSIPVDYYEVTGRVNLEPASFDKIFDTTAIIITAALLGFAVSLLFFMDQGISAQLVNTPNHGLKKGNANDYDFIVVGLINIMMSLFGLPFMHGLLPHSPLHVQSLADWEEKLCSDGTIKRVVVKVRETRLAVILCHIMISLAVLFGPQVFSLIPVSVLDGLFFYCALSCLRNNSFFDRLLLLITQQSKYPPTHYIKKCPQKKVHYFTGIEFFLTVILVYIGFSPWPFVKIFFPAIIALLIPIRHLLLRKIIGEKFVKALDTYESE